MIELFIRSGGGWIGIHAAADTEYDWPWYEDLVGPPGLQTGTVRPEGVGDALTQMFPPAGWRVTDEFYNFASNPGGRVRVIATLDEASYLGGTMGADHPIAWCYEVGRGRAFYTGLGHRPEMFDDEVFRGHVAVGLAYAAGLTASACRQSR